MSTLKTNKIQTATDSDLTLDTASTSKRIIIPTTTGDDTDLAAISGQLVLGNTAGTHLALDDDQIMAKAAPLSAGNLKIQEHGGKVYVFGASSTGKMGIGTSNPRVPLDIY